jgi:hypothetical protein
MPEHLVISFKCANREFQTSSESDAYLSDSDRAFGGEEGAGPRDSKIPP